MGAKPRTAGAYFALAPTAQQGCYASKRRGAAQATELLATNDVGTTLTDNDQLG
jgi:hypothetical protein